MFDFLFKKQEIDKSELFNSQFNIIKKTYNTESISDERKEELYLLMEKYGYLPYSQAKALSELTPAEVIYCLEKKLEINKKYKNEKLIIIDNETSPLKNNGYNNADWIKKEQHDIKIINLAALGDGSKSQEPAKFIDWLRQIIILPAGNLKRNILSTTIYLIPFHPRDFGNAYLTAGLEEVSKKLTDKQLENLGIDGKEQIQLFIALAQLCSHPVIYDVSPQTGRFSKTILVHPELVRWIDIKFLTSEITKSLDNAAIKLSSEFDEDDITIVKNIYKTTLKSGSSDLSPEFKQIYDCFTIELENKRKELSNFITKKEEQKKIQKRVKDIVAKVQETKSNKIKTDKDITKRGEIINQLIEEGLWTLPNGAWCSSGIPVFEKMSEGEAYPIFKHYNVLGHDVTKYAESDCQTPFYFVYLENGEYNLPVINFYLDYLKNLQKEYNFDGYRISHTDFIVDEMSEKNSIPISYRVPRLLLKKANEILKKEKPYFATIAEYRLNGSYYKEYHQDMGFDILWGNDAKTDYEKNPSEVINNNRELQDYNESIIKNSGLSILKTYNNQDGEFRTINRDLQLIDKEEALFKWFKFRFLPGGKLAQRPIIYTDGDESFSKYGIEPAIQEEISSTRDNDEDFFNKFDALRRFAINNELTTEGEAQIITQNKNGFISWMISKETIKESLIIAANYLPSNEKILKQNINGIMEYSIKTNNSVTNKTIEIPGDFVLDCEYIYDENKKEYTPVNTEPNIKTIQIEELKPSEFKIYKIKR